MVGNIHVFKVKRRGVFQKSGKGFVNPERGCSFGVTLNDFLQSQWKVDERHEETLTCMFMVLNIKFGQKAS